MIINREQVSLKHLLTVEALNNQEVLGLIRRAQQFKQGVASPKLKRDYYAANLFLKIVRERIRVSTWLSARWD